MITSTDDTCEYVHEGSVDKPDVFRLVSKQSVKARGTRALFDLNKGKDQMNGIRCKISLTMNAIGAHSPIVVSISGLSDYEMPIDEDVLAVEVPGLCVGGGVRSNTHVGYILFLKKNSGADQKRYAYYHEQVLIPFYNKYRKELLEYDSESGMICPDEFTGAAYCDGDVPQVNLLETE
jgi:hypothetical protein